MPHVHRLFETWNALFTEESVRDEGLLGRLIAARQPEEVTLFSYLDALEVEIEGDGVRQILELWPKAEMAAIQHALESAVSRQIPVSIAWTPGYDTEVTIKEWRDWQADEPCAMTILLKSRHASDHPGFPGS